MDKRAFAPQLMGKFQLVELIMNKKGLAPSRVSRWLKCNVYEDGEVLSELHLITGRRHLLREAFLRELKLAKELSPKQVEIILKYNPLANDVDIF
jgi:hypothetical protein